MECLEGREEEKLKGARRKKREEEVERGYWGERNP
jgi:hypothetical protein